MSTEDSNEKQSTSFMSAPAALNHGLTTFAERTTGKLQLDTNGLSFIDDSGQALFTLKSEEVKKLMVSSDAMQISTGTGQKYTVLLDTSTPDTSPLKLARSAAAPGIMLSEAAVKEDALNVEAWLSALYKQGYNPRDFRSPKVAATSFKYVFAVVVILFVILLISQM